MGEVLKSVADDKEYAGVGAFRGPRRTETEPSEKDFGG